MSLLDLHVRLGADVATEARDWRLMVRPAYDRRAHLIRGQFVPGLFTLNRKPFELPALPLTVVL